MCSEDGGRATRNENVGGKKKRRKRKRKRRKETKRDETYVNSTFNLLPGLIPSSNMEW